jgi:glycerol-3-phosphate acyltransferase PlsY
VAIQFGLLILGAYLLGSVPAAYLAARWSRHIDIRQYSDGNVGATNLLRLTSKWVAIPVILFDVGKGMAMVWVAQLLGLPLYQQVIIGAAAIIGHNWSVFLRFSGGRGVLTTLGVALILEPKLAVVLLVIAFSGLPFGQMAMSGICAIALLPISSWFSSAPVIRWLFNQPLGVDQRLPVTLAFLAIFLIAVVRRLAAPRTSFTASVPLRQLLLNRLLFDRDIGDRQAWIHQSHLEASSTKQPEKHGKG